MKHLIKTTIVLSGIFLLVPSTSLAINGTPSVGNQYRQENREIRQEQGEIRADAKGTQAQTRQFTQRNRIRTTYQGLTNAFTRRIESLKKYQARIQTRLTEKLVKLPGNTNLTSAQTKLNDVNSNLIPKFDTNLAAFRAQMEKILTSDDPKSLVPQLKTQAKLVQEDLKNIRQRLVEALRLVVQAK